MKQYQQDYNSTAGLNTVQTLIKNQKSKKDRHSEEPVHVTRVHNNRDTFQPLPLSVINRVKISVLEAHAHLLELLLGLY